ncbi:DUF1272 domain-containing protein [Roseibium sp. HPY-6]|uniref:DUF1272 domain-containing protein n=1 Tax=Roseibium sp. HPY-6 TaxID=3229852 RepID=UPI00338D5E04
MLPLKPNCGCCEKDLPPDVIDACMCTFECTFCAEHSESSFDALCRNRGGNLVMCPTRPESS